MSTEIENAGAVEPMVISVRQPWAWLIIHAGKDIENRDWPTKVRGRVLIHASKGMTNHEFDDAMDFVAHIRISEKHNRGAVSMLHTFPEVRSQLQRGGIIGSVDIVDCVSSSQSPWFQGRYGFVLANPKPLPFRPCNGKLGFFRITRR